MPPLNGGHLRTVHLVAGLARRFDTVLLSHLEETPEVTRYLSRPTMAGVRLASCQPTLAPRNLYRRFTHRLLYARLLGNLRASVNASVLSLRAQLSKLLHEAPPAAVVLENLPPEAFCDLLRRHPTPIPLIYNAHNVDSALIEQRFPDTPEGAQKMRRHAGWRNFRRIEERLHQHAEICFACSQFDLELLQKLNRGKLNGYVVPNGVDLEANSYFPSPRAVQPRNLLFCGSLHYAPNLEGLKWFLREVWPLLEHVQVSLTIIGRGRPTPELEALCDDPRIDLIGEVDSPLPYYQKAELAIVPLLSGSGTRLKVLEAMSLGVPLVSTTLGAQGIEFELPEVAIADAPADFAAAIQTLLDNPAQAESQRFLARKRVEQCYGWDAIGAQAADIIAAHLAPRPNARG